MNAMPRDRLRIALAALAVAVALVAPAAAVAVAEEASTCNDAAVPVSLAENLPDDYVVHARLCLPSGPVPETVHVLAHGATYSGIYWDFPYQPGRYSYVRALVEHGYATLDVDRLAFGASSHPPSAVMTIDASAHALHQVIQAARSGRIGPVFRRVVLVGHSMGTAVSWNEAATYHDVDGLVATGNTHRFAPAFSLQAVPQFTPASADPQFARSGLDPGYLTTKPGSRGSLFYRLADADPAVIAVDEATKDTVTNAEFSTYFLQDADAVTLRINVPVLVAVGQFDQIMCGPGATDCSSSASVLRAEAPYYSAAACLDAYVLADAGHDLNLHLNAREFFDAVARWSDRWWGVSGTRSADGATCS